MELPSRVELRQKNLFQVARHAPRPAPHPAPHPRPRPRPHPHPAPLFQVADLRMTWHDQGHFLCVKVDKHSKSKKTLNSAFELFRLRDKGVPIEVQEFSKDL